MRRSERGGGAERHRVGAGRLTGTSETAAPGRCRRPGSGSRPQKATCGTPRSTGDSISKKSRGVNDIGPAISTRRELLGLRVVVLHVRVVDPARRLDLVLDPGQLGLEPLEVLRRPQLRVGLRQRVDPAERLVSRASARSTARASAAHRPRARLRSRSASVSRSWDA